MPSRIEPLEPGESDDEEVNEILEQFVDGWWADTAMMGTIGHQPDLLKSIIPVFEAFFAGGRIEPELFEMMRLKTGEINRCAYCASVRSQSVRDEVGPKEDALFGEIDAGGLTARERLGIELAEQMAGDPNYIADEFFDELHEEFTDEEIVELVFACSVFNFGNKFNITAVAARKPTAFSRVEEARKLDLTPNQTGNQSHGSRSGR
jgi:alkylhydroperoxidase family enzyme